MSNEVSEPTSREEIEAILKTKVESGEAEPGLYDIGLSYLVVNNAIGEGITFQWFENTLMFSDILNS